MCSDTSMDEGFSSDESFNDYKTRLLVGRLKFDKDQYEVYGYSLLKYESASVCFREGDLKDDKSFKGFRKTDLAFTSTSPSHLYSEKIANA